MNAALPQRLNSIQALRGIAAVLVLFFHIAEFQRQMAGVGSHDLAYLNGFWNQGWAGVDLFFVISGFIMIYVTRNHGRRFSDIRQFLWARITRIYPLWWACCTLLALYFYVTYGLVEAPDRVASKQEAWAFFARSLMLIPQERLPILTLGWTLIHEMFFYLVFAVILCAPRKVLPSLLALWGGITLFGYFLVRPNITTGPIFDLIMSPLSLEFIFGAFAGILVIKRRLISPKLIFVMGMVLSALSLFLFPYIFPEATDLSRVIVFTLPMSALLYGASCLDIEGEFKTPAILVHLGNWSYSIYLTHYLVLISLRRIYRDFVPETFQIGSAGNWDDILFVLVAIILSIGVASLSYRFIERPSLLFFRRKNIAANDR